MTLPTKKAAHEAAHATPAKKTANKSARTRMAAAAPETAARRPRHPADGGYARGEETRRRIVEAALELFGEYGYDGASTRDIAARAGVNAPALQYYFENKEGVYRACANYIADEVWETFAPAMRRARAALDANADTAALTDAFLGILDTMADKMFAKPHNTKNRLFFAREQSGHEPPAASEILQARLRAPLNTAAAALLARITGTRADDPVTLIRLLSVYGQLMMFHVAPRSTLTLLGWKEVDAPKRELLKKMVREQTCALLAIWAGERGAA